MKDVGARQALAVHWGTFLLTDEPLDQPPKRSREVAGPPRRHAGALSRVQNGETRRLQD